MTHSNKNDTLTSGAISAGVIGVATILGAAPIGIAAGSLYLALKLFEGREDPNTIGYEETPAPHRKKA